MGAGQLAVLPTSLALGSVKIGASQTQSATLINSGSSDLTVRQATVTGKGFRMSGLSFPLTLAAGQRKSFTVTFTPQSAGSCQRQHRSYQRRREPGRERAGVSCRHRPGRTHLEPFQP